MFYVIQSSRGYWLPGGNGYTSDKDKAGHFAAAELGVHRNTVSAWLKDADLHNAQ